MPCAPGQIVLPVGTRLADLSGPHLRALIMHRSERLGSVGHWIWDETSGACVQCSEELARIYEMTVDEYFALRGENAKVLDTLHPDDQARYASVTEGAFARGEPYEIEFRVFTKSGALRHCYEAAEQIFDESGRYLGTLGIVRDITATKEIEGELRRARDALGELFQSLALPVFVLDPEGRVSFWNRAAERVFGWRAGEVIGRPVPLLPEDTGFPLLPFLQRQVAREGARPLEVTWRRQDGSAIPLSISLSELNASAGGAPSLAVVAVDLTEQRAAEHQVAEQGEQLRFIVENLPVPVVITRGIDGVVLFANEAAKLSFGHAPGVTNLRSGDHFWTEADRSKFYDELDARGRVAGLEICFRKRDGSPFLAVVTAEPITFAGVDALMSVALDVTEQRRAAEELRHSQRLEAVGQLTGGIAHDFNNLLTIVLGNAEALANDPTLSEPSRRLAQIIADTAERGANLTRQLLAFARRQALQPSLVQVNALIEDVARLLRRTMAAAIEIETRLQADLPPAMIDRSQLETALINLVLNSRDALPRGGRIVLETELLRGRRLKGPRQLAIRVIDNGAGMTPEVLGRAFEPFFTTKETGQGSGLGLSMVYGFAAQSGGSVRIESTPGEGTVVHLHLPVAPEPQAASPAAPEAAGVAPGGERILLVEDEPLVREFVAGQLQQLGYAVTAVEQGNAALALLEQRDKEFDLLLTDNIMPGGLSGQELCRQARRLRPALRALLMSGYAGADLEESFGEGLLRKPFNRRQLAEAVRLALEERTLA